MSVRYTPESCRSAGVYSMAAIDPKRTLCDQRKRLHLDLHIIRQTRPRYEKPITRPYAGFVVPTIHSFDGRFVDPGLRFRLDFLKIAANHLH
jgi:hypothetical protein